jgi:predicted neutral ceramidase superfamily lipid hydrolase
MIEVIKQTLARFADANLGSEAAVETIATAITQAMNEKSVTDAASNPALAIYTPEALYMFKQILNELEANNMLEKVPELYDKIIQVSTEYNNGTCLAALGEAIVVLVTNATQKHETPDLPETPEVPSQENPAS